MIAEIGRSLGPYVWRFEDGSAIPDSFVRELAIQYSDGLSVSVVFSAEDPEVIAVKRDADGLDLIAAGSDIVVMSVCVGGGPDLLRNGRGLRWALLSAENAEDER